MAKIKIRDLPKDLKVSKEEMNDIRAAGAIWRTMGASGYLSLYDECKDGKGVLLTARVPSLDEWSDYGSFSPPPPP
jgi:hypothetical protein